MTPDQLDQALRQALPDLPRPGDATPYLTEPRGRWQGQGVVVAPRSVAQVQAVMRFCHGADVPVVPYAGGTGLVSGQIRPEGAAPVVLSVERLSTIRRLDPTEDVAEVEAGVILDDLRAAAAGQGRLFPLALASGGSARIGGLLATNAGGVNVLRYGSARALCLGLEVVLADGQIWSGLSRLRKDNTGYDLRDLFIGSEGTLGVITAASLRLMPRPADQGVALMAVASPDAALRLLSLARGQLGEALSAFELISAQSLAFLRETGLGDRIPYAPATPWMVLIEAGLSQPGAPEALTALFAAAEAEGLCEDGVVAQSDAQAAALWAMRESIPEANRKIGAVASHDIALPIAELPAFIAAAQAQVAQLGDMRINCFGHLGDGNLHYNLFPAKGRDRGVYDAQRAEAQQVVHDLVHRYGGSFSAEHGVGRHKVPDLERYGDPVKLALMRSIKAALDPKGIMNPGAVLRVS